MGQTNQMPAAADSKWMQTVSGRAFWPLTPRAAHVCIEDIAHALAMKCRYTGHCREFYSVAQHAVLVSHIVPPEDARWGLMHDAAEAYLPDVARPIKKSLAGFADIEAGVMAAVAEAFGLPPIEPPSIKHADLVLLATERRDLMAEPPFGWEATDGIEPMFGVIYPLGPKLAKSLFLNRFADLFPAPALASKGGE